MFVLCITLEREVICGPVRGTGLSIDGEEQGGGHNTNEIKSFNFVSRDNLFYVKFFKRNKFC